MMRLQSYGVLGAWRMISCGLIIAILGCGADEPLAPPEPSGETMDVGSLSERTRVDHLDSLAREPMLIQHPSGTLFVSGYGSQVTGTDWTAPPLLWRSDDGGENWSRVDVGKSEDGAQGNSDVDLAVGPDGTLYFASMGFDRSTGQGVHVRVGVSRDNGRSWNWQLLSEQTLDDRPWVKVAPDGTVHLIWNNGDGVHHHLSDDAGTTWKQRPQVHHSGGSSHLAIGPEGELAVRVSPMAGSGNLFDTNIDLIATSADQGETWSKQSIPGNIQWVRLGEEGIPRWVEPLAWGPNSTLYHLWSEGETIWLGWSVDMGANWEKVIVFEEPGMSFYPFLVSNPAGELAATWFVSAEQISARLALIQPRSGRPEIMLAEPIELESWTERGQLRLDPAGEYLPVFFLNNGDLGVAMTIQDRQEDRWGFSWRRYGRSSSGG